MPHVPYYRHPAGATLYLGDCRDVLPELGRGSADMLLTDPPYGMEWQGRREYRRFDVLSGDDGTLDVPGLLALALPVLRNTRHVYIFGRFDVAALPLSQPVELIWDKCHRGLGNLTTAWGPAHEPIMFATYQNRPSALRGNGGRLTARLRRGSVLHYPRPNGSAVSRHPTEKPVGLLRELIESSSCMGELVLDPFCGSGSTLVAALLEGRRAIGIEIDERYAEVAARRLDAVRLGAEVYAAPPRRATRSVHDIHAPHYTAMHHEVTP